MESKSSDLIFKTKRRAYVELMNEISANCGNDKLS